MNVRTMARQCIHCRRPIPFDPTAGKMASFCPSCLKSQRTPGGDRPPKVSIPKSPLRRGSKLER